MKSFDLLPAAPRAAVSSKSLTLPSSNAAEPAVEKFNNVMDLVLTRFQSSAPEPDVAEDSSVAAIQSPPANSEPLISYELCAQTIAALVAAPMQQMAPLPNVETLAPATTNSAIVEIRSDCKASAGELVTTTKSAAEVKPVSGRSSDSEAAPVKLAAELTGISSAALKIPVELMKAMPLSTPIEPPNSARCPSPESLTAFTPETNDIPQSEGKFHLQAVAQVVNSELKVDLAESADDPEPSLAATHRPELPTGSASAGIPVAKHTLPMQTTEKMKESADQAEQNLPVTAALPAAAELPAKAVRRTVSSLNQDNSAGSDAIGSSMPASIHTVEANNGVNQISAPNPVRAVERVHDLMALQAERLRDSGVDSLEIVIKPSAELHLSLSLTMREGTVEVNALLQRGNYDLLNRHWSELQQQLEARGVRLAPLSSAETPQNGNASFSEHSRRQPDDEKPRAVGAFVEFALNDVLVPKTATKSSALRGWESWA